MTKGNAPSRPRWPEAIKKEIEDKLATRKYLLVLQRIPNRNKTFPRTTCYVDEFCSHTPNESIPGSFRISLERKSLALSSNLGYQAMVCYSKATRSASYDRLVGIEKKGEQWYDLDCMEELWEEKVRRLTLQDTTPLPVIHPLTQIVKFIIPERRIIKKYPQAYALSSPLEYALNLWRAVYHWQCFVNDPDNQDMLRRLNGDVYPYENFPEGVYKARVGEALYFDLGMWEARGFARNGRFAELRWDEVRNRSLSAVMSMALKHEAEVEKLEVLPHLEEEYGADSAEAELARDIQREQQAQAEEVTVGVLEAPVISQQSNDQSEGSQTSEQSNVPARPSVQRGVKRDARGIPIVLITTTEPRAQEAQTKPQRAHARGGK